MRLFLSYSSLDREVAQALSAALRERGFDLVADVDSVVLGEEWRQALMDALANADGLVVLLTEHSIRSPFVVSEIGAARAFIRERQSMFLAPVVVGDIDIPNIIQDIMSVRIPDGSPANIAEAAAKIAKAASAFDGRRAAIKQSVKQATEDISTYVDETVTKLRGIEKKGKRLSFVWSMLGWLSLVGGASFGFYQIGQLERLESNSWMHLVLIVLKAAVFIALVIASAKYAFDFARANMNEALRSADRAHAISYGKLYLRLFGAKITPQEVREVFQTWNISNPSSFSGLESSHFDPKLTESLVKLAEALAGKRPSGKPSE